MAEGYGRLNDDTRLWRRVPGDRWSLPEEGAGEIVPEPQGNAFRAKGGDDGVSVGLAAVFEARGEGPDDFVAEGQGDATWGVLEITVGQVRELGFDVEQDEVDHALITPLPSGKKSRRMAKELATWIKSPRWP